MYINRKCISIGHNEDDCFDKKKNNISIIKHDRTCILIGHNEDDRFDKKKTILVLLSMIGHVY